MTELAFAAIADDFTGATDLANMLVRAGLRAVLAVGVDGLHAIRSAETDAIVIALKTRSIEARLAVEASVEAADALLRLGAKRIYFKYCSTFDSTAQGNIGPVADALRARLKAAAVPFVPSFPENGRSVFHGHLFVGDALLNESGMERHPLNPMRDANLVRVLASQSRSPVALINRDVVRRGPSAVKQELASCMEDRPLVILDAIDEEDLKCLAAAFYDLSLVTGGSALAFYLARHRAEIEGSDVSTSPTLSPRSGRCAILAGSCSRRTQEQIFHFAARYPALQLPVDDLTGGQDRVIHKALDWIAAQQPGVPSLIYSAEILRNASSRNDPLLSAEIESAFAAIALILIACGFTRLIVAGGETSGAVITALKVRTLKVGPEISPGVPWTQVIGGGPADGTCLALKSGNFGAANFFSAAFERLEGVARAA